MRQLDETNILSPEEQKCFDKIMNEYTEQNQRINQSLYKTNMSMSTKNHRNLVVGGMIILFIISIGGLWKSFQGMDEESKATIPPAPVAQEEQPSQTESENKYLEEQEELRKTEEMKSNFHPFDGAEIEQPPIEQPSSYIPIDSSPPTQYSENNTYPNYEKNYPFVQEFPYENKDIPVQQSLPELKGTAQSNSGIVCYIEYNGHTGTYKVGDKVGEYTVKNITTSQVFLVKSDGNEIYLNK